MNLKELEARITKSEVFSLGHRVLNRKTPSYLKHVVSVKSPLPFEAAAPLLVKLLGEPVSVRKTHYNFYAFRYDFPNAAGTTERLYVHLKGNSR